MVGSDHHQRIRVLCCVGTSDGNGTIKLDGLEQPALRVHRVGLLVDTRAFYQQHKALRRSAIQYRQRTARHLVEHRLVRQAIVRHHGTGSATPTNLVEGNVHIGVGEQTENLGGVCRERGQFGSVRHIAEASLGEIGKQVALWIERTLRHSPCRRMSRRQLHVTVAGAARSWRSGGQEPATPATHQYS